MYGLPHADIIAQKLLEERLSSHGCFARIRGIPCCIVESQIRNWHASESTDWYPDDRQTCTTYDAMIENDEPRLLVSLIDNPN